jgi:hypothetical protein
LDCPYPVDSDFVRGLPPAADELQFIDRTRILEAQKRVADSLDDDPLICGVDVSGGGAAWNVIAYRRVTDARSIPPIRIPGEHTRDRSVLVGVNPSSRMMPDPPSWLAIKRLERGSSWLQGNGGDSALKSRVQRTRRRHNYLVETDDPAVVPYDHTCRQLHSIRPAGRSVRIMKHPTLDRMPSR